MLLYPLAIALTILSASGLFPSVIGELTLVLTALVTAGVLFWRAGSSRNLPWSQGILSFAFASLTIGLANLFWVYGDLQSEFPAWADFGGTLLLTLSYVLILYALAQGLWNLHARPHMTVGFSAFIAFFAFSFVAVLGIARGLTNTLEAGTTLINLSFPFASGAMIVFALISFVLGFRQPHHSIRLALVVLGVAFCMADILYLVLPESIGSLVWNSSIIVALGAMHSAAYSYLYGAFPGLLDFLPQREVATLNTKA